VVSGRLQQGFANPIDQAILDGRAPDPRYRAVDEVPFDFTRKRLSVLVDGPDGRQLLTKGAFASVLGACDSVLDGDRPVPLERLRGQLEARYRALSDDGYRVLALARRDLPGVRDATVGYLGDGINDAGALHLADVGISVDSAADVARGAAAIVLLDKDLGVLVEGVRLGRQTFANTLKYVFTTVSANFGNTCSLAAAAAFLPFLPLLPRQILVLNFLSDIPSTTIAVDNVDPEQRDRPHRGGQKRRLARAVRERGGDPR
jgi:magnesium-transporting ATPase (P-type)